VVDCLCMSPPLALAFVLTACQVDGPDACSTADNGTCEELAGCTLGSDSTDCDRACADPSPPAQALAACAFDDASEPAAVTDPDLGSDGSGGLAGTWDSTVFARGASSGDEIERHFRVYVPRRYDPREPTPVLFNLGGFSVDQYFLDEYTELNRTADLNNFIVVYGQPEWRDFGSYWVWAWYVYENAYQGDWADNPDLDYLREVHEVVRSLYNVDETRVYATGHSRGAALSVIAGFEMPDVFSAACAQAGFTTYNEYDSRMDELTSHPAVMLVHGDDDPDVPVEASDDLFEDLTELGWVEGVDLEYLRLAGVTHRWQPQYNEQMWRFLSGHALAPDEVSP
jgi:predicted esterase